MKFGFIAHPGSQDEKNMLKIMCQASALSFFRREDIGGSNTIDFLDFTIKSKAGTHTEGKLCYIPWLPEDIVKNSSEVLPIVCDATKALEDWGAEIIGLGGYTACIGGRGEDVQRMLKKARITTGNVFTSISSVNTLRYILQKTNLDIKTLNTVIVGFPGSIALLIAKMLLLEGAHLTVVGRRKNLVARKYFADMPGEYDQVDFTTDIKGALVNADVVFTATTTGNFIPQELFAPGSLVIDVGEPKDVCGNCNERTDILIADGGRFGFAEGTEVENVPFGNLIRDGFFGCMGETALLALEENPELCSTGRILDIKKADIIAKAAEKHGFITSGISQWRKNTGDEVIYRLSGVRRQLGKQETEKDIFAHLKNVTKEEVLEKYSGYINSVLVAVNRSGDFDRLYKKAEGMYLWDSEGNEYLDFVGGYGSVNLGHNHRAVLEAVRKYTETLLPSILQVAPGYCAAMLAEKLASIMPGNLEKVFFCNSGTEAVEGALKMARLYTGRNGYISTKNSFHGKSLGSLSVTGREKYQEKFRPLLAGVSFVDFNSLDGLESLLCTGAYAAMIVEPVQGEGGIHIAEAGYLEECQRLCHKYGTLLIVDEVQTGFGRTGKMFAVQHGNVIPDIITCSKSLGGGLVPLGAYVTTKEIWDEAYGSQSKYLLHTSTFGGNSFCTAVGYTAIETIEQEKLPENAERIGEYLLAGLERIAKDYTFIKEVRGKGLLIGIEFEYDVTDGLGAMADLVRSMIPAEFHRLRDALSGNIVESFEHFLDDNIKNIEQYLNENFASQFSASLLNRENILTIVTLNNPNVIRIEPPLIITSKEADRFLEAFARTCERNRRLDFLSDVSDNSEDREGSPDA